LFSTERALRYLFANGGSLNPTWCTARKVIKFQQRIVSIRAKLLAQRWAMLYLRPRSELL
jgi:hypothetical protein